MYLSLCAYIHQVYNDVLILLSGRLIHIGNIFRNSLLSPLQREHTFDQNIGGEVAGFGKK